MYRSRLTVLFALGLAAALAHSGAASRSPAPQGGGAVAVYDGEGFSSRNDGPPDWNFQLQVNSFTPGPKATTFQGTYFDEFGFAVSVNGKITSKRKITFAGKGGPIIVSRPGGLGLPNPGATLSVKFTGQMSASGILAFGTYKNTYKNYEGAPSSPFKDLGGWYFEQDV